MLIFRIDFPANEHCSYLDTFDLDTFDLNL